MIDISFRPSGKPKLLIITAWIWCWEEQRDRTSCYRISSPYRFMWLGYHHLKIYDEVGKTIIKFVGFPIGAIALLNGSVMLATRLAIYHKQSEGA